MRPNQPYRVSPRAILCWGLLLALGLWGGVPAAQAQGSRLMLNVLPIKGTSLIQGYTNWIEIEGFKIGRAHV